MMINVWIPQIKLYFDTNLKGKIMARYIMNDEFLSEVISEYRVTIKRGSVSTGFQIMDTDSIDDGQVQRFCL